MGPSGPLPARVMIVGEAPGTEEELRGAPFMGPSGYELTRMLGEAGIDRSAAFITNVARERPQFNDIEKFIARSKAQRTPQHSLVRDWYVLPPIVSGISELKQEIAACKPSIIIALGNTALWALTGQAGISKWRGSMLYEDLTPARYKVIPTMHPAAVLRDWALRAPTVRDLRRAAAYQRGEAYPKPDWKFVVRPSFLEAELVLTTLLDRLNRGEQIVLSVDIETRLGHIACIGLAWSLLEAICIPLMATGHRGGYWTEHDEFLLIRLLRLILTHRNAEVVGQNLLYDCQYFARWLGFVPRVDFDTMVGQHALFSAMPKSLGFLASLYCKYFVFWKDEGKDWRETGSEDQLWRYNCRDCVYTLEVFLELVRVTGAMRASAVQTAQQVFFHPVLYSMRRGVLIDQERRAALKHELEGEITKRKKFLERVLGHKLNPASPKQMKALFYDDLRLPVQMTRAKKGVDGHATLNDEALQVLAKREPLVRPLVHAISDLRTLNIFLGTFVEAPLDWDGRIRCSYNIGGSSTGKSAPKTYRISSSENAFGGGANLQTIPSEKSKSVGKAAARGTVASLGAAYALPNLREMFVPDPGRDFWNGDLDRADLQVVAWEAEDALLKAALREGADVHLLNVYTLDGQSPPALAELVERHGLHDHCSCKRTCYWEHRLPRKHKREFAKVFCHATNYVGSARTVAAHTGRTIREVERAQTIWFGDHPGILAWHRRVQDMVVRRRCVENRFGYKWYIFDRVDNILPEAVAWIPQSTVSIIINKIWIEYWAHLSDQGVEVLLQVHDSLAGQFPSGARDSLLPQMQARARIVVPYEDPLTIPFNITTSSKSWGDC